MTNEDTQDDQRRIREWLLAILRFAVTLEQADRAAALSMAEGMDRLGSRVALTHFCFFVRTSVAFCDAIAAKDDPARTTALGTLLRRIEDDRLRRALETVLAVGKAKPRWYKRRPRDHQGLFKGLPNR